MWSILVPRESIRWSDGTDSMIAGNWSIVAGVSPILFPYWIIVICFSWFTFSVVVRCILLNFVFVIIIIIFFVEISVWFYKITFYGVFGLVGRQLSQIHETKL